MRVFHGWVVVAGAFLVLLVAYGAQWSVGIFFSALLEEFRWNRASLAGAFSLYAFIYSVAAFPAGRLTDRWGPRAVIAIGGLFLGSAMAGMALVSQLWQPYLLYGVVAALGMGTAYVPCSATVVRWFVRRRGLAVGVASSGSSVGNIVLPPLAQLLISAVGWRAAYVIFGVGILVVLNLVALVMRRDPESIGLTPDGDARTSATAAPAAPPWPLGRALTTSAFWMLGATFMATWIPVFIPFVHIVPFARDLGHTPLVAASVVSAVGAGAVVGRLALGAISDRIGRRPAVAFAFGMQALSFLALIWLHALPMLYTIMFAFGFSYGGAATLFPAIVGDFFGREQAGALVGLLFAFAGSMAAIGPLVAGVIYDAMGSYNLAFALSVVCNLVALALLSLARPPRALLRPVAVS